MLNQVEIFPRADLDITLSLQRYFNHIILHSMSYPSGSAFKRKLQNTNLETFLLLIAAIFFSSCMKLSGMTYTLTKHVVADQRCQHNDFLPRSFPYKKS